MPFHSIDPNGRYGCFWSVGDEVGKLRSLADDFKVPARSRCLKQNWHLCAPVAS